MEDYRVIESKGRQYVPQDRVTNSAQNSLDFK